MASSAPIPTRWNRLALVGFLLSLVFPLGLLFLAFALGVVVQVSGGLVHPSYVPTPLAYNTGLALLFASVLAAPAAILSGHSALDRAKRGVYRHPLRGLARLGLVLGYGAFVAYFVGIIVVYWVLTHMRMHIVF